MATDQPLRDHVLALLSGGEAHITFEDAVNDVPPDLRGKTPPQAEHSLWQLLEHMRIAQVDILEFAINPKHVSPEFPAGYWPASAAPANEHAWDTSIKEFRAGHKALMDLVTNPATDLFAKIPHGDGQTILRQALLTADHNAYHLGQFMTVRRLLGNWH
jgi:hypothetical protein